MQVVDMDIHITTPIGYFLCMGTAMGMVITHIIEGGIGITDGGTGAIKGAGKADIMEAGEDMAGIVVVGTEVGIVDKRCENEKGLTSGSKRNVKRESICMPGPRDFLIVFSLLFIMMMKLDRKRVERIYVPALK
jgi:hypothetical protein